MKKKLFLAFMASTLILAAKVPLSQAVVNAWKISPGLDSQKLEENAADTARLTALRRKYFSLYLNGSYRYTSDTMQVKLSDFPFPANADMAPETIILSTPNHNIDMKISLLQPVYSGGMLSNAVRMEAIREAAERDLTKMKKLELAGKVKSSFFNHRLFSRKRDSLNLLLDILKLHQGKLENLYAEELVRKSDLLETRTKVDEIRLNLEDLEQLIRSEALNFSTLCGYEPGDIDADARSADESLPAALEFFLARHPLLHSLDERARILQIRKKTIRGSYLPQVNAAVEFHYGRPGQNIFVTRWTPYVLGMINVSLPIFNWNQGERDKKLVDIAARKLQNQRDDFVRESERNLRQLYFRKESLEKKLALLDSLVANAAEDARLKEALYSENQIDHNDYLAALTSQERSLSNREELLAQVELTKAGIHVLIGKLEEE
ncbi:MAG: TolC family protein [Candidatus Aminicenantes bacterium]|nr:TolC family protein [Candidatus Aminicenantes bacterium]